VRELRNGIREIVNQLEQPAFRLPIVAKIETPQALREIDAIVDAADAVMIARGDLGVEMDLAQVPVIQKRLMAVAQSHGKPCIVATQMLESMIREPTPTRAEANDVANAIFDQTDAVMLSGETAVGRYPVLAVEHMRRIALETEAELARRPATPSAPAKLRDARYRTAALAHGVWTTAHDLQAKCIVVWSQFGGGARYLSQNNFHVPILAATSNERSARQMQLLRGVTPACVTSASGLAGLGHWADEYLTMSGRAAPGDFCILVAGEPLERQGSTNCLLIHTVGERDIATASPQPGRAGPKAVH
jgi:pyruvate kinase